MKRLFVGSAIVIAIALFSNAISVWLGDELVRLFPPNALFKPRIDWPTSTARQGFMEPSLFPDIWVDEYRLPIRDRYALSRKWDVWMPGGVRTNIRTGEAIIVHRSPPSEQSQANIYWEVFARDALQIMSEPEARIIWDIFGDPQHNNYALRATSYGWPMRCYMTIDLTTKEVWLNAFYERYRLPRGEFDVEWVSKFDYRDSSHVLWKGLAINVVAHALCAGIVMWFGWLLKHQVKLMLERRKLARLRCQKCGYDIKDLQRCPECGNVRDASRLG